MTSSTASHGNATKRMDEPEAKPRDKLVPLVMSVGAKEVLMVRTHDLSLFVITDDKNKKTCEAAQQKIAEIRSQAGNELSMSIVSS